MARKKSVPAKKPPLVEKLTTPIRVRCIADDCWAGGSGFLSIGDEAVVTPDAAERLRLEKKIELVKG